MNRMIHTEMINNFEIVVARYNEDISWLNRFKNISIIYNKGKYDKCLNNFNIINLPNFGRESHTYLYHIINNYDNLKEYTIFTQGNLIFDNYIKHKKLILEQYFQLNEFNGELKREDFNKLKYPIEHFGKWKKEITSGKMRKSNYTCYSWLKNFMDFNDNDIEYVDIAWGAIFSVHKSLILKKPKIFYEHLLRFVDYHDNPEEGHFFERSWNFIFTNKYIKKERLDIIKNKKDIKIKEIENKSHLWIDINYYKNNFFKIDNIKIFPNYYFKMSKNKFNFNFKDFFYIKIKLNEDDFILLILSIENNFNLIFHNTKSLGMINNILNKYDNSFNYIIESNILKLNINNVFQYDFDLENLNNKYYNIDKIDVYCKSESYNNNIILNKGDEKLKYIILINQYFDINNYYKDNYLDNFINYIN